MFNTIAAQSWGRSLLALIFLFVTSSCKSPEPIRVGFAANLTGPNSALGVDGRDGALLAVEKINAEGGVNGHPIELVIRDDLGTSQGAIKADEELANDEKVSVIIGHMTSSAMMAVWPEFQNSGVVFISPTVSTPQLSGKDDNFLRLIPVNSSFSARLAEYASAELGLKKVAVLYDTDNAAFTGSFRDGFAGQFTASGGTITMEYPFSSSSTPDFRMVLEQLQDDEPDGLCIVASAVDTALIAQQSRLIGLDVQLLVSNWALTDDLIENGGQTVDGILTIVAHQENSQSPAYLDFSKRFQERFGREPTFAAGYGYESILVLVHALKLNDGNMEGIRDALLQTHDLPGVNGRISFDRFGDVQRTLYLVTVRDGQFLTTQTFPVP